MSKGTALQNGADIDRIVGRIARVLPQQGPPEKADYRAAYRCLEAIAAAGYVLISQKKPTQ